MTRKSSNADIKLLNVGRKLLIKKGASSLSIRELCQLAEVNLGMFSYHFKSKDVFVTQLLETIYDEFLEHLELSAINKESTPLETLRNQLLTIATFARDNRAFILSILNDVLDNQSAVQKFVRLKMKRHFKILANTLATCQKQNLVIAAPTGLLITHIVGGIGLSNLIPELLKRSGINKVFQVGLSVATKNIVSDEALKLRVDMVIKGLLVSTMEK